MMVYMLLAESGYAGHLAVRLASFNTWVTFFIYVAAGLCCLRAWRVARLGATISQAWTRPERRRRRRDTCYRISVRLWCSLGVGFMLVAVNRLFDVYSWSADIVRQFAFSHGVDEGRRVFQVVVLTIILLGTVVLLKTIRRQLGRFLIRHQLVVVGTVLLMSFLIVRAVSFHYLDAALDQNVLGLRVSALIEMIMICIIMAAAVRFMRWSDRDIEIEGKAALAHTHAGRLTMLNNVLNPRHSQHS